MTGLLGTLIGYLCSVLSLLQYSSKRGAEVRRISTEPVRKVNGCLQNWDVQQSLEELIHAAMHPCTCEDASYTKRCCKIFISSSDAEISVLRNHTCLCDIPGLVSSLSFFKLKTSSTEFELTKQMDAEFQCTS